MAAMQSDTGNPHREVALDEKIGKRDGAADQSLRITPDDGCASPSSSTTLSTINHKADEGDLRQVVCQRPDEFSSTLMEVGFIMSVSTSLIFDEYMTSGFLALVPILMDDFSLTSKSITWPSSVPSLVISAFLLAFGRLADRYGGFPVYFGGMIWALAWTLVAGFSINVPMLIFCRAMQGLGAAAHLPASLMMLGRLYRPGPRKNLVFSIYGAMAPCGFFTGILVAGLVSQYAHWSWYFWIGTVVAFLALVGSYLTRPRSPPTHCEDNDVQMDWPGSIFLATGLILSVFAITEVADAPKGWRTPYILATAISAVFALGATFVIEGWMAKQPLLPASVFQIKNIRPLLLGLLLSYGTVGLYVCYATL